MKNVTNQQIGSACSAFVEMLGHECLLIRTYISVGLKLLAHRNSSVKGTAEKRREICHNNEQDISTFFSYSEFVSFIFNYITISSLYLFLTPNSRSVFCAGVSLNIHSFIVSEFYFDRSEM